jgi:hypothetical protein
MRMIRFKIRHYFGVGGVFLVVIAWMLTNAYRYPWVYRIVAPRYARSASTLESMHQKDFVLKNQDEGFRELSKILEEYFEATISREITQIKTLGWGTDALETPEGEQWDSYLELEVSFANELPLSAKFYGLKSKIEKAYLTSKLVAWKDGIFWSGITISVMALFL